MKFNSDINFAKELDNQDDFSYLQDYFNYPENNPIYFCGHSLGLQPKNVTNYIQEVVDSWKKLGVSGHIEGKSPWFDYHTLLTPSMSKIVGSKEEETVIMNSLTTNLHLLMVSFFKPTKDKFNIIIDTPTFSSDKYAVQSQLKFHGLNPDINLIEIETLDDGKCKDNQQILEQIELNIENTAMILFSGVNYYTGQYYDIKSIAKLASKYNCVLGLDLAHAAGNVNLDLHEWGVDFASWCGYKYLNGGPGAPSGIFVHEKYNDKILSRFEDWWGHDKKDRFNPPNSFKPLLGAEAWQLSNPPILSMASLRCSLDIFNKIDFLSLSQRSKKLTAYLEYLINYLDNKNIQIITPINMNSRGAQLSLKINSSINNIEQYFKDKNIICDYRKPNVIRIAPNPFYNTFQDVFNFVELLKKI
ncbi:MAG: kynureninase [Candidatus Marinimicrobia bacterium]|nr:kynureninase [Candidatus Neomarinimicrobiota bacterium]